MSVQEQMKKRLAELREENAEIERRRMRRDQDALDADRELRKREDGVQEFSAATASRWRRRMNQEGTPRDVVFLRKMAIPGKRRKT